MRAEPSRRLEGADLRVQFEAAAATPRLSLRGTADGMVAGELEAVLSEIHVAATHARPREILVDIRGLEFMNASCFKALVTWIVQVRRLPSGERYQIRFLSTRKHGWQRQSLRAFGRFGGDLVAVDEE